MDAKEAERLSLEIHSALLPYIDGLQGERDGAKLSVAMGAFVGAAIVCAAKIGMSPTELLEFVRYCATNVLAEAGIQAQKERSMS